MQRDIMHIARNIMITALMDNDIHEECNLQLRDSPKQRL